jgi:hypothetical protein
MPCGAPEADEHARQAVAAARRLHRLRHRQLEAVLHLRAGRQGLSTSCEHATVHSGHAGLAVQAQQHRMLHRVTTLVSQHERCCHVSISVAAVRHAMSICPSQRYAPRQRYVMPTQCATRSTATCAAHVLLWVLPQLRAFQDVTATMYGLDLPGPPGRRTRRGR